MFALSPLRQPRLGLLWGSQLLSATGSEFYMVAVIWTASSLVGNDAGYVSALQAAALLAGSLLSGILTDRWRQGATMIGASLLRAGLLIALWIAAATGTMTLPLLALVAVAVAFATSTYDPALQATLPHLAPAPSMRHGVNALFDATRRAARILGPSLIAVVSGFVPVGQFFVVTATGFLLSAAGVGAALRGAALPRPAMAKGWSAIADSLLGGLRTVRSHRVMRYGLAADFVGNIAWSMGLLLGMALLLRETSAEPLGEYSLMMTAYGVGNLGANLVLASVRPTRPALWLVVSKLTFGTGVLLLPFAPDIACLMLLAAFAAVNGPFENLALLHMMQNELPPERIAQVYRLIMCAVFAGQLVGYGLAPLLFDRIGIAASIVGVGALTVATGLYGLNLLLPRGRAGEPR